MLTAAPVLWAQPLSVCVSADSPPQSYAQPGGKVTGFDVQLAQAIAQSLGRELKLVPFDSEYEKESTLAHEVNALLSSGVCDLVSGFPLVQSDLGPPSRATARTPDYPGAKRKRERPFVPLGALAASRAYQTSTLAVVLRADAPPVSALLDLQGRKIGAVPGTLGGTLVSLYKNGALRSGMVSLTQREDTWAALASGRVDALVVPSAFFDAYRLEQPQTTLVLASYQRPVGINLGFAALASQSQLLATVNQVIGLALTDGRMASWAHRTGLSWQAPVQPDVAAAVTLQSLVSD
jgi:ABC-type amino acid transport substrate-binding protein